MRRLAAGVLLATLLAGCDPGAREAAPYQGVWRSEAWGMYVAINGGSVAIFEFSSVHCIEVAAGGARGLGDVLALEKEFLVLSDAGRTIRFEAQEFLPIGCLEPADRSAGAVFDVVVGTFEAHYARDLGPGWTARAGELRPTPGTDDDGLRVAIEHLLQPLDRPDVRLVGDGATWVARPPSSDAATDLIVEDVLEGDIAYLAFRRFGGFGDDIDSSQRVAADAIDRAVDAAPRLILDLRASSGGSIDHAMLVASRFVPEAATVAEMWAVGPDGRESAGAITVQPLPTGVFSGQAAVLVGPGTVGVAELLAASLRDLPDVTLVGQPTAGSAGPGMVRGLPNGWSLGLPNLEVILADGTDTRVGVVPDLVTDDALATARAVLHAGG